MQIQTRSFDFWEGMSWSTMHGMFYSPRKCVRFLREFKYLDCEDMASCFFHRLLWSLRIFFILLISLLLLLFLNHKNDNFWWSCKPNLVCDIRFAVFTADWGKNLLHETVSRKLVVILTNKPQDKLGYADHHTFFYY